MGNRYTASKLTLERAQELDTLQRDGTHSWSDILREYGVSRYQIKHRLDKAQQIQNIHMSHVNTEIGVYKSMEIERDEIQEERRFIKPRFIPDCLACRKQTASLQYSGYFCSLECAAIWALDYLQSSTTPEWCPFCKAWLKQDMSLLRHIYAIHPLEGGNTHES